MDDLDDLFDNAGMRRHHREHLCSVKLSFLREVYPYYHHRCWPFWPFKERHIMAFVTGPTSIQVGATTQAELQGFDQSGNPIAIPSGASFDYSVDNPAIATVAANAGANTATVTGVAAGTANVTGKVTLADGTIFTDTQAVTVTAPAPVLSSVKLAFGS